MWKEEGFCAWRMGERECAPNVQIKKLELIHLFPNPFMKN
jgi:hypothetical protein